MTRENMFKKIVAWLICAVMIIGMIPNVSLPASAETTDDWEGDIDVVETTEPPAGSEENPIQLNFVWADDQLSATAVANVPAGETYHYVIYINFSGPMTISGPTGYDLIVGEDNTADSEGTIATEVAINFMNPMYLAIANSTEDAGAYTFTLTIPEGTFNNPEEIEAGYYSVDLETGSDAYYYTYIAEGDGVVNFTMYGAHKYETVEVEGEDGTVTEGNQYVELGWIYNIQNVTTSVSSETHYSDDDEAVTNETLEVSEGDEILVMVNTYDPENPWTAPAGTVEFYIEFSYPAGSELNPIMLLDTHNVVENEGEMYYQGYFSGMIMTVTGEGEFTVTYNGEPTIVEGEISIAVSSSNPRMPVQFSIDGDGEYTIDFVYPVGAQSNPAVAVLGDNACSVDEGSNGYYWIYTAEEDGDLIVTVDTAAAGWFYVINNMSTGSYGDSQWSDSDPVVNPATITVAAGNEIQIIVNTYDVENPWTAPAGDITVNLAYACEHTNKTTTNTATCTEAGVETVTCDDCGEVISETAVDALGHDYSGENGACIRCGEYQVDDELAFYAKAMLLGADIRGIFQVRKYKETSPYESFKVIVEKGGVETELELVATSDKTNYTTYGYALTVPAKEMADVVNARIVGITADGVYYVSNPETWSIKEGAIALMDTYASKTDEASVNKMKLCANMLNYGAEAQKKFSYNLDNLATDGLSEAYAALIITTTPEMETIAKTDDTGATAPLKDIVFNLAARVQVLPRFTVPKADAKESYSAVINQVHVAPDGTETVYETVVIDGADCLKSGTTFAVYIDYLAAKELRDVMTITLYKDGEAVSATHTFSAESVLKDLMDSYPTLIPAMMNFCDCARAVFG